MPAHVSRYTVDGEMNHQSWHTVTDGLTREVVAVVQGEKYATAVAHLFDFEGHARAVDMKPFVRLVDQELESARQKYHPHPTIEHSYAVLREELEEIWEEVRRKTPNRRPDHLLKELVQLAAMAQRAAEDLGFVES